MPGWMKADGESNETAAMPRLPEIPALDSLKRRLSRIRPPVALVRPRAPAGNPACPRPAALFRRSREEACEEIEVAGFFARGLHPFACPRFREGRRCSSGSAPFSDRRLTLQFLHTLEGGDPSLAPDAARNAANRNDGGVMRRRRSRWRRGRTAEVAARTKAGLRLAGRGDGWGTCNAAPPKRSTRCGGAGGADERGGFRPAFRGERTQRPAVGKGPIPEGGRVVR